MTQNIEARLTTIKTLFTDQQFGPGTDRKFIIPAYQREYRWNQDHCDKLWQDIENFIVNKKDTYFFGTIIIEDSEKLLHIVDGQQRLTTFMLLLKALLMRINELLKTMASDAETEQLKTNLKSRRDEIINCLYSIDKDDIPSVTTGKKLLSELSIKYENQSMNEEYPDEVGKILERSDFDEIEKHVTRIKHKKGDNKYTNFFRNFKFFKEKLKSLDSTRINEFARKLLEYCQIIVVKSYQTEEAIEIFKSLNSTGLPLADADILSAILFSKSDDQAKFKETWKKIKESVKPLVQQGISIDNILNQYMYIRRANDKDDNTTLSSVRKYFTVLKAEYLDPDTFIKGIEEVIRIWQDEESTEEAKKLKYVVLMHDNNIKFFYATYLYFNGNEVEANKQKFVEALLKLFAVLSITKRAYSNIKSFLYGLNVDIATGGSTNTIVQKINKYIVETFRVSHEDICDAIINEPAEKAIIYLNEYLFAKEKGKELKLDSTNIQVEHIMPSSGKNIATIRGDANMNEEEFKEYVEKLGNKILLEGHTNASIGRNWFQTKKENKGSKYDYAKSEFPIAKSLSSYPKDKWKKDDIDEATERAAKRIADFIFADLQAES